MKKVLLKILFFLLAFLAGGLIGFILINHYEDLTFGGAAFAFEIILSFLLSYVITTIVHEAGHLVFGLISGYGFSSFRVGSLMLIKINGKIKLRSFTLAGTGGQCLMIPPEGKNGKQPVILYNLGGVIFNLIFSVICIALFIIFPYVYIVSLTILVSCLLSVFLAFANGIPMHVGGVANDGMNALSMSKDDRAKEVFMNQLRMNAASVKGVRLSDMPDEWFAIPEGADMNNVTFASIAVFAVNRSFESLNTEKSEKEIEELLNSGYGIIGLHKNLLTCDLITCRLINNHGEAEIDSLITPELKKLMETMKNFISVIRTEYVIALLRDRDEKEAEKKLAIFEKVIKNHPNPSDIENERRLMELALERYNNTKMYT